MKVTYNWLKDFVEIKISPQKLADKLTMAGLEVTSLEKKDGDFVFEIEVTSNRPDWLSIIGIAREIAAVTGKKLKSGSRFSVLGSRLPAGQAGFSAEHRNNLEIKIENKKDCPLYTAKIINDVKVGPSPEWLRKRLELIGCRSVNNVVDITNYVLFELGEPLHAFDLDKLVSRSAGQPVSRLNVIVRRAAKNEKIITLDGQERILDENMLIIAADINQSTGRPANRTTGRPIAIAGVMGSRDTEVTESTKNVLLEAAIFNPILIRRARQKLGIQTDSSYRFERGIDLETACPASLRAAELIREIGRGKCVLAQARGQVKAKKRSLNFNTGIVSKTLGLNISAGRIKLILKALGFKAKPDNKNWRVAIPSFRRDVNSKIDLLEEIARIAGYESIPKSLPACRPQIADTGARERIASIKGILAGLGLNEAITYSLIDKNLLRAFSREDAGCVEISNPLSRDQGVLRPTLIPSLCRAVSYNLNQRQEYVNIFEIARVYTRENGALPRERLSLAICLCGTRAWLLQDGLVKDTQELLHLKGIIETLFERLGIKNYNFKTAERDCEIDIYVNNEKTGTMGPVKQEILETLDIKNKGVFVSELSLDKLLSFLKPERRFTPLPVYPGISRDISLVIKDDIQAQDILEAVRQKAQALLKEVKIVDFYKGRQIPAGFKGLTISCFYRSDDETLTEARINPAHSEVSGMLRERFGANIRG